MWFNVGYWKNIHPSTYKNGINPFVLACRELTNLLTESVGMEDGYTVLDVGSGCGEQDFFILDRYKSSKIVAIEISPYQVQYSTSKATTLGISGQVCFEVGNAVELESVLGRKEVRLFLGQDQLPCFDVAIALDCAYHFQLRTDFFKQVYQVLKPAGKIGLADVCLADGVDMAHLNPLKRLGLKWLLRRLSIPPTNIVDRKTYKENLENCGFTNVTITLATEHVFEGLLRFAEDVELRLGTVVKTHRMNKLRGVMSFLRLVIERKLLEYIIVSAEKTH